MMVAELDGVLLDYWVARAEGWEMDPNRPGIELQIRIKHALTHPANHLYSQDGFCYALCGANRPYSYSPSTNWALAGPIIEREGIIIKPYREGVWGASYEFDPDAHGGCFYMNGSQEGKTPLIAAMRAYVASKFGEEVEDEPHTAAG